MNKIFREYNEGQNLSKEEGVISANGSRENKFKIKLRFLSIFKINVYCDVMVNKTNKFSTSGNIYSSGAERQMAKNYNNNNTLTHKQDTLKMQ